MALVIIDGVPGSGKTLYAVHHLISNHYCKIGGIYEKKHDFVLITNIDDFQLPHVSLSDELERYGGDVKQYFSIDFQRELFELRGPSIYVIDEAQFIFDRKFYDKNVFNWFQYHRHFGQTIYLISQNAKNLPTEIQYCTEYIIRALPRSRSLFSKVFHYSYISGRDVVGGDKVIASKSLFSLYQSQYADSAEKIKRPFLKVAAVNLIFGFLALFFGARYLIVSWGGGGDAVVSSSGSSGSSARVEKVSFSGPVVADLSVSRSQVSSDSSLSSDSFSQSDSVPYSWRRVSSVQLIGDSRYYVRILYNGVWSIRDFPYKLKLIDGDYYAYLPVESVNPVVDDVD